MTTDNRYLRPSLTATLRGVPDPLLLVDSWLWELEDLKRSVAENAANCDELHYDLVSLRERLRRVRPDLLDQLAAAETIAWADAATSRLRTEDLQAAMKVCDLDSWVGDAEKLGLSAEDWMEPSDRAAWAEAVLTDLDDADLVLCLAERKEVFDDRLADRLASCNAWVADHAELFLPAGVWVQAVGQTIRPDLPEQDVGLAVTAEKFVNLLDTLEDAEADGDYRNIRPFDSSLAKQLWQKAADSLGHGLPVGDGRPVLRRPSVADSWLPPAYAPLVAAAAEEDVPEFLGPFFWNSPDASVEARLVIPARSTAGESENVVVTFHRLVDGCRAADLAGTPVLLSTVAGVIGTDGTAVFVLGQLRAACQPPTLRVGSQQTEWHMRPDSKTEG